MRRRRVSYLMTNQELKVYDRAFGLHSKIPPCCVEFYVTHWESIWTNNDSFYHRAVRAAEFGYVPCPTCLGTHNKVKIKRCIYECGGEHREDFMPKRIPNAY